MHTTRLAAATALLGLASCHEVKVSANAGYAQLAIDGDIGFVNGATTTAVSQDIESALGLGDDQGTPYGRAQVDFGVPVLTASGFLFEERGSGTLTADFGSSLPAGTNVRSDFTMANAKVSCAFEIPIGPVTLAPGLAVDWFDISLNVRDSLGFASEDIDIEAPLPLGFLRGQLDLGCVSAVVEGGYVSGDLEDAEATVLDLEAMLEFRPNRWLDLFVGYRRIDLDASGEVDGDTIDIDAVLGGFVVGGGVRF